MLRHSRITSAIGLACLFTVICCYGCSKKAVDLTTAESTISTYVRAHNSGNHQAMRQCGMATSLKGIFLREDHDVDSKKFSVPVDGIKFEILGSTPGRESVTRMFTTRDLSLRIRFSSKYDRGYEKTVEVRMECRRTVYDEEDTWQIL